MKIDGRAIAQNIYSDLRKRVGELEKKGITPHMAVIMATSDPAIQSYVNQKKKWSDFIGAKITVFSFPDDVTQETLFSKIQTLNNDPNIHGIVVQQPMPRHIDSGSLLNAVSSKKDIDGFQAHSSFDVPIVLAVMKLLEKISQPTGKNVWDFLKNKKIVIMGKGVTSGGPLIAYFKKHDIFPSVIDSKTENTKEITKTADILISAVGKPSVITSDMLKRGVILIGIGMSLGEDGKLKGDYNEEEIADIASFYTPIPGGTGPINVAMLLQNLIEYHNS